MSQVHGGTGTGMHSFGAIYDLVPPSKNMNKPVGEWNSVEITCKGPEMSVKINGEQVSKINLDDYKASPDRSVGQDFPVITSNTSLDEDEIGVTMATRYSHRLAFMEVIQAVSETL